MRLVLNGLLGGSLFKEKLLMFIQAWISILIYLVTSKDKKIDFFGRFFGEKSIFGGAGKDFRVEKLSAKKLGKIADFSAKNRKNPIFSRKNLIFPEIWGKLNFRSLRGEKLKNGANQSCKIKKKVYFWEK